MGAPMIIHPYKSYNCIAVLSFQGCHAAEQLDDVAHSVGAQAAQEVGSPESAFDRCTGGDGVVLLQVVLPEGMAAEGIHSAAGLQILAGELLVSERTVEQVQLPPLCRSPTSHFVMSTHMMSMRTHMMSMKLWVYMTDCV